MITREQAADIARADAAAHGLRERIARVHLLDEVSGRAPVVYGVPLENCWIAFLEPEGPPALRAGSIVVIDRSSGRVVYRGCAGDEG